MPDDTREYFRRPMKRGRSRARRVLGVIGSVVGATVTFVVGAAAATLIHLDRPAVRRVVATQGTAILGGLFKGSIQIEQVRHLSLSGLEGVKVRISDPEGVQVLAVEGVNVRVRGLDAARSALFGKGPIVIDVPSVWIGNVDVNVDGDARGENLRLANAFESKTPPEPKKDEPPGRGVRVEVPKIGLGHAWAHGTPPGAILVDAELKELAARAHVDPKTVHADLDSVGLVTRALPRGANPQGKLHGAFEMAIDGPEHMDVTGFFDGDVGGLPTSLDGRMNDKRVDARVDVKGEADRIRALAPEVAVQDAATIHLEAHGDLPKIDAIANVRLGQATVDANAAIDTTAPTQIAARVSARKVDVSRIAEGAPSSELGLDLDGHVALVNGVTGEATIDTLPGRVDKQAIPAAHVQGSFAGQAAKVKATIKDASMPTDVTVDLSPRADGGQKIAATVRSRIPELRRIPVVGEQVGGAVNVDASANVLLPEKAIDAQAVVVAERLQQGENRIGRAEIRAKVRGSADAQHVDADVHARTLWAANLPISSVDAWAKVDAAGSTVTVRDARVEAVRPNNPRVVVTSRLVRVAGDTLKVEGAEILGLGEAVHADVEKVGAKIDAKVDAPRIDIPLVTRLAGQHDLHIRTGTVALKVDGGVLPNGDARGTVHVGLRDFAMGDLPRAEADLDVALAGRRVGLDLAADVGSAGTVKLHTDELAIGGPAADPESWKRAHGKVAIDGDVDLDRARQLVPPEQFPLSDLRGHVFVQGRVGRDTATAPPEVQLHAHTVGLVAMGKAANHPPVGQTKVVEVAPWRVVGTDVAVDLRNDATSGFTNLSFRVTDGHGIVTAFDAKTTLPYADLVRAPDTAKDVVLRAPLSARLIVPPRRLADMPAIAGTKGIEGAVEADIQASGTVHEPRLLVNLRGRGVRTPEMPREAKADADLAFGYDGKTADLAVRMRAGGKDLLVVVSHVDQANIEDVLAGKEPAWVANARVKLAEFPLESIPQAAERRVRGRVSGELTLDDLHRDAKVKGKIDLARFSVGKAKYEKGAITVDVGGGKANAKVRLDQTDGFLEANAGAGLQWGAELAPSLDEQVPMEASLKAHAFRATVLQPFIQDAVPSIDGRIEADAHAKIVPGKPGAELSGMVAFTDGSVTTTALGDELRKVRARVDLSPDGTIKVTDVYAEGAQGMVTADALVKLDGFRLADATANVRIPENKPLSAAVNGMPVGDVSGIIKLKAAQSADGKETKLGVDVEKLDVELPQVTKTGVVQLEDKENVYIGTYRDGRTFVKLPMDRQDTLPPAPPPSEDPSRTDIDVNLGQVTITRGNMARVVLGGKLKVRSGAELTVEGKIATKEGWAEVQSKKFVVEKAEVTFNGEAPPNPVVNATAGWTAFDGSKVYVDFVGPVSTGKVTLRSEPPRPRNEVLAMILFGTPDGVNPPPTSQQKSGGNSAAKTAANVGGGFAAEGLTDALDDLAGVHATAKIGSTANNNPKPELEFQLSEKVSVAFSTVIGTPPVTEPDRTFAEIEYRFKRNWSLEAVRGDRNTMRVDAIWQKRY